MKCEIFPRFWFTFRYNVTLGAFKASVDWDSITGNGATLTPDEIDASGIFQLVRGYVDFNGILKNITGKERCYDAEDDAKLLRLARSRGLAIPETLGLEQPDGSAASIIAAGVTGVAAEESSSGASSMLPVTRPSACPPCESCPPCPVSTRAIPPKVCTPAAGVHNPGSWGLITCNDGVNMSAVKVKGVGGDAFWRVPFVVCDPHCVCANCKGGIRTLP